MTRIQGHRTAIEAMGYRVFSYVREFRQMRKAFLFFDLGLAAVAMVAVVTAALGIMNTMAVSVSERRTYGNRPRWATHFGRVRPRPTRACYNRPANATSDSSPHFRVWREATPGTGLIS